MKCNLMRPPKRSLFTVEKKSDLRTLSDGKAGLYLLQLPNITIYIHPRQRTLLASKNKGGL